MRWRIFLGSAKGAACTAVLFLAFVGAYYVGVKGDRRSAFNRWRPAVVQLAQGVNVYERNLFPTPPIMGLTLAPFAWLPAKGGMASWFAFKVALCAASMVLLFRMVEPTPILGVYVVLALSLRPVVGDLLHGNVNLWVLFWIVVAIWSIHRGRDAAAGISLSLAVASKLTPALLLVYFVWKRAWRLVAASLVGLFVWLFLAPSLIVGPSANLLMLRDWTRHMVAPYLLEGQVDTEQVNQSLPAVWHRLVTPSIAVKPDDGRAPYSINVTSWSATAARLGLAAIVAAILGLLALATRGGLPERGDARTLHEVGLVLVAMLVLSERSWKHHFVLLIPSYVALVAAAFSHRGVRAAWIGALLAASALWMSTTSGDLTTLVAGPDGAKLAQAYGAYLWAALCVAAAHGIALHGLAGRPTPAICTAAPRLPFATMSPTVQ